MFIQALEESSDNKIHTFNGHKISKTPATTTTTTQTPSINMDIVRQVVGNIGRLTQLSIYGVDFLVGAEDGVHYVVDVNPFPGSFNLCFITVCGMDIVLQNV